MPTNVVMPQLGESVTEGTVTRWLKNVGDVIKVDEAIVEVSTDKVDTEIPSPVSGILLEIKAAQDSVIQVGGVMAIIGESGSTPVNPPAAPVVQTPTPVIKPEPVIEKPVVPTPPPVAPPVVAPVAPAAATVNVLLPALGESVTEGTITRWLKNVGDLVSLDEAIVEISTDKVDTELPSPAAGVIKEIKVAQDQVAAVGAVLAIISTSTTNIAPKPAPTPVAPVIQTPPPAAKAEPVVVTQSAPTPTPKQTVFANAAANNKEIYATPIVRQLAKEKGVDLSTINGTGINGRIKKEDLVGSGTSVAATPAQTTTQNIPTPAAKETANKPATSSAPKPSTTA